ncbi:MAG: hypothetical protein IJL89_08415, partial [Firmicutes bacterium]|nr:hypothetical protein [Bacillota bacterium]
MSEKDELKYRQSEYINNAYINDAYIKILNSASLENNSELEIILRYLGHRYRIKADTLKKQFKEISSELGIS